MKTLQLTVSISNQGQMDHLVDSVCKIMNRETEQTRDKFKMVTNANSGTLLEMCKFLKVDLKFNNSDKPKSVTAFVEVNEGFDSSTIAYAPKSSTKEKTPAKKEEPFDEFESMSSDVDPELNTSDTNDDDIFS